VLIPVRYLINGTSIVQERVDQICYWHVELDRHDVILAARLPAESFLDTGNRSAFSNGGPIVDAHPNFSTLVWEAESCAPLVVVGEKLERVRAMLQRRVRPRGAAAPTGARLAAAGGRRNAAG
ncbi:MAG: Hint domain-containing protein, partial [Acetobacteraceae bacterium]